jgi:hypothetical protein
MAARNALLKAVPYQVEHSLKKLGADLKTARLRRNLTLEEVAQKIGAGRFVVADAEKGKPSTGIAIYAAMLWVYGMIDRFGEIADPSTDAEGTTLSLTRGRARRPGKLDNDF